MKLNEDTKGNIYIAAVLVMFLGIFAGILFFISASKSNDHTKVAIEKPMEIDSVTNAELDEEFIERKRLLYLIEHNEDCSKCYDLGYADAEEEFRRHSYDEY